MASNGKNVTALTRSKRFGIQIKLGIYNDTKQNCTYWETRVGTKITYNLPQTDS
jgi:hypothetical protein